MARRTKEADAIDRHIGKRIREQRENMGMTQGDLAVSSGVSYQQIHKYESGMNRISAGRLGIIAEVLRVSVQSFFEGADLLEKDTEHSSQQSSSLCLEIARNFRQIDDPRYQQALHLLVRVLAN